MLGSGVAVYFECDGQQFAVPCDRWGNLLDNAQAIAKYFDAKRTLERYGVQPVSSEFKDPGAPECAEENAVGVREPSHVVLDSAPDAVPKVVRMGYRAKIQNAQPDQGWSQAEFEQVQ